MTCLLSSNLWKNLIDIFSNWIVNYGWTIIVFTIVLKIVLSPIDIMQRLSTQKQTRATAMMQPELDAINKKYANDRERLNQETNKLYKKNNVNMGGICLTMLLSLVVTWVVFFTLYSAIRSYGNEKLYTTYSELDECYVQAANEYNGLTDPTMTEEEYISAAVQAKYDELAEQNSWLWVKNVWKTDTSTSQFVDFEDYAEYMGLADDEEAGTTAYTDAKARYAFITSAIVGDGTDANGYYVLIILAAAVSFLTQFISAKILAPKGQKLSTMNKVMFVLMPVIMVIFASTSNVVFTLYQITNSVFTALLSTIISLCTRSKQDPTTGDIVVKKKNVEVVEYSRNYRK